MRNRRAIVLLVLATALGLAAALLFQNAIQTQRPLITLDVEADVIPVVIAKVDLPMAAVLKAEHLEIQEWPENYQPPGAFHSVGELEGRVLRRPFAAGEVVQGMSLLAVGSKGGLGSVIEPNYRAVSVKVDPIIGVAGFITPGSRVDVLATVRRVDWQSKQSYAKAVLQNVKVLAIDQKLEEVGKGEPELVSVVTLEVKLGQAEELTFMSHEGQLQLALRGPTDDEIVKTAGVTVSRLVHAAAPARRLNTVEVVKGTEVHKKSF
jgi:pilus assembly protein CpaB